MPNKKIKVPPLTAKMLCDLILKWLDEPEHQKWLEQNIETGGNTNDNDE